MNLEEKVASLMALTITYVLLMQVFDNKLLIVKGLFYAMILIYASIQDVRSHEIGDIVHVLIIIVGCIDLHLTSSLIGLIIVPIPFLIPALIQENSIGGGDIKLMAASGFTLGIEKGFIASLIGLVLAIVIRLTIKIVTKNKKDNPFPMAPYLSIGCFIAYMMG